MSALNAPRRYPFEIVLAEVDYMTEDAANALYEAGCDDGSCGSSAGAASVMFHREAATLERAIASAARDVAAAGFAVARVTIDGEDLPALAAADPDPAAEPGPAAAATPDLTPAAAAA